VLTQDDVRRIACEERLTEFAESLVGVVRPGWRLDLREEGVVPPSRSKIGGEPDLAPDESWPINYRGIPMTFLAQVNCDELPEMPRVWRASVLRPPPGLLLRVFADLLDNPFEPGAACVLATSPTRALVPTAAPGIPAPWPVGGQCDDLNASERVGELPQAFVRPTSFLTAPERHPILSPEGPRFDPMANRYYAWANRLRLDGRDYNAESYTGRMPWEVHHLLGEASSVQSDVRFDGAELFKYAKIAAFLGYEPDAQLADPDAWQSLLSLHNDNSFGLEILDGGSYTVLVPTVDLRVGRFHRTVCSIQSS
jgi:Domain of unknown function (DUF1963)